MSKNWFVWQKLKSKKALTIFSFAVFILLFLFQNCSKVGLEAQEYKLTTAGKGEICKQVTEGAQQSVTRKFIFIMDMSKSNIAKRLDRVQKVNGVDTKVVYLEEIGSDRDGKRFDAIEDFIKGCGAGPDTEYLFIPFSESAGEPVGSTFQCTTSFGDSTMALAKLKNLRDLQTTEMGYVTPHVYPGGKYVSATSDVVTKSIMGGTNYPAATKCLSDALTADTKVVQAAKKSANYTAFFLTDGKPESKQSDCSKVPASDQIACYISAVSSMIDRSMIDVYSANSNLKVQPIFYGKDLLVGTEVDDAKKVLGAIATEGNAQGVIFLDQVSDLKSKLCGLANFSVDKEWEKDTLMAVNLNARFRQGRLQLDSDGDGLTDEEEVHKGFDPFNPRTFADTLDSLCDRLGGASACQAVRAKNFCSAFNFNLLGLNECDAKALGLAEAFDSNSTAIDSDHDGIPDYLELIFKTNPAVADSINDSDNDGVSNQAEIARGTDPSEQEKVALDAGDLVSLQAHFDPVSSACADGSYKITFDNLPLLQTKAMRSGPLELQHGENENVILLYYRTVPKNTGAAQTQYWASFVKVKITNEMKLRGTPGTLEIKAGDFKKVGEVKQ